MSLTLARQWLFIFATAPEFPHQTDVSLALIGPPTSARPSIASGRSISVNGVAGGEIRYCMYARHGGKVRSAGARNSPC